MFIEGDLLTNNNDLSQPRHHVVVVGGGFAGAAAASALTEAGHTVTLLESRATLGGRAQSWRDGVTGEDVDNGQHLFMGCYTETLRFLSRLRVDHRVVFQDEFSIPYFSSHGNSCLKTSSWAGNLGLLWGLCRFQELSFNDKFHLLSGLAQILWTTQEDLNQKTVSEWLSDLHQTPGARRAFWDPLCLATLNEKPEVAAAQGLAVVLYQGLLRGKRERRLGYATLGLGKIWAVELSNYLKRHGGLVANRQKAVGLFRFLWP